MSWKESLTWADASNQLKKKASFRTALFFVDQADTSFGRRNVVHQYPTFDVPFIEDLGRDIDEFFIRGYVVQNNENSQNYFSERDALIEALRAEGPGLLIHPFLGEVTVSVLEKARMTEKFREGGIARFDMNFVKAIEISAQLPGVSLDFQGAVDSIAGTAIADSRDGMGRIYG